VGWMLVAGVPVEELEPARFQEGVRRQRPGRTIILKRMSEWESGKAGSAGMEDRGLAHHRTSESGAHTASTWEHGAGA
jgi:hypothetical protein